MSKQEKMKKLMPLISTHNSRKKNYSLYSISMKKSEFNEKKMPSVSVTKLETDWQTHLNKTR